MVQSDIRQEVYRTIKPWRAVQPPVRLADLVLAAFLVAGDDGLTKTEAVQWIYDHFDYYRDIGMSALATMTADEPPCFPKYEYLRAKFGRIFSVYGLPIWTENESRKSASVWQCDTTSTAYLWRKKSTYSDDRGAMSFTLLDLPAEVRNTIYDMVFQYPASGVCPDHKMMIRVRQWCPHFPFSFEDWLKHRAMSVVSSADYPFALLQVCRQIHKEAATTFLASNLLVFPRSHNFVRLRLDIDREQARHITRIAIPFWPWEHETERNLIWLQQLPKLTELHIYSDERGKRPTVRGGNEVPDQISYDRAAALLAQLPCFDDIDVEGDCPKLRAALAKVAAQSSTGDESGK